MILVLAWTIIVLVSLGFLALLYTWFINDPETFIRVMIGPVACGIVVAFVWAIKTVLQ